MIVGGTFDKNGGKSSTIVKMLAKCLNSPVANGGSLVKLTSLTNLVDDLNIWMPNVSNDIGKIYPHKKRGSIVICSKVMRSGTTLHDAVARIFRMHGNAVIAIDPGSDFFKFTLIDALGNVWVSTHKIAELARAIKRFQLWMKGVRRAKSSVLHKGGKVVASKMFKKDIQDYYLHKLCEINTDLADKVELAAGTRYFGNTSTRCEALFPSIKMRENYIYVSKRNVNKERLTEEDFVLCRDVPGKEDIMYVTDDQSAKPSVDTPIQVQLYKRFPKIMCMIHGHAYVKDAPTTAYYWPCGDLREVSCASVLLEERTMCINLKNHGFLAVGTNLADFELMLKDAIMVPRIVGEEEHV